MLTAFAVGSLLAPAVSVFARVVGLDRDRAFYPTVLIVVASLYVLFAVLGGSREALVIELVIMSAFVACAVVGFRKSMLLVAAGLAGHGVLDFFHAGIVTNPGVPEWWPAFCGSYDVVAGVIVAAIARSSAQGRR